MDRGPRATEPSQVIFFLSLSCLPVGWGIGPVCFFFPFHRGEGPTFGGSGPRPKFQAARPKSGSGSHPGPAPSAYLPLCVVSWVVVVVFGNTTRT